MNPQLVAAIVTLMCLLAPPGRRTFIPEAQETREIALDRYEAIAGSITRIATDPDERPIVDRSMTIAMLVSITYHESAGWRRDVDLGLARDRLAKLGWNDKGRAWCLGQIELGSKYDTKLGRTVSAAQTAEGWSGDDLIADRDKCIRAVLHRARSSFDTCHKLPFDQRLAVYAGGTCAGDDALSKSERRVQLARKYVSRFVGIPDRLQVATAEPAVISLTP